LRVHIFLFLVIFAVMPGRASELESTAVGSWSHGDALADLSGLPILEIRVLGNLRTRDYAILRELSFYPGEIFDSVVLQRDLRFLQGLGLFLSTDARAREVDGGVLLLIEVEERGRTSMRYVYPMLDFDDRLRVRAGLTFRHRNLRGKRDELRISGTLGWVNSVHFNLKRPWLGARPLEHHVSYFFRESDAEDVELFREQGLGFHMYIPTDSRHPREHRFILGASLAWRKQEDDGEIFDERLPGFTLGYSHDGRDSFTRPKSGKRLDLRLQFYHPRLGSSASLRRWLLTGSSYRAIGRFGVLAGQLKLGLQEGELFHRVVYSLGGLTSVRGWAPGHFSGWDSHDELYGAQGRNQIILQLEWRRTLFSQRRLRVTRWWVLDFEGEILLFLDRGMLWRNGAPWDEGVAGHQALGYGGGLRIFSPLGDVLRLEFGLNPEGGWQVHLGSALPF
jgi:outer membrane protein assembly factor BamA